MKIFICFIFFSTSIYMLKQWKYISENALVKFVMHNNKNEIEVEGVFTNLQGGVTTDSTNLPTKIVAIISTKTINTGVEMRDESIKSSDFFDTEKYPTFKFESTKIEKQNDSFYAYGNLQIKNITKPICIVFTMQNQTKTVLLKGNFSINRLDYNIGTNGDGVGNMVNISLLVPIKEN